MTLKWHDIVNSQYIAMQLYMRVDNSWGTLPLKFDIIRALDQLHSWRHFQKVHTKKLGDTFCIPQFFETQYLHE